LRCAQAVTCINEIKKAKISKDFFILNCIRQ
jgi:hypothetical protein